MTARHSESGIAMVTALVTLLLVTVLGLSLTTIGMVSVTVANNDRETNEALAIADAGLTHAKALLLNQIWISPPGMGPYDQLLQVGDGIACTGDEFSAAPSNASQPYPPVAELIPAAGRPYPAGNTFGGRYVVRLCDDHTVELTNPAFIADPVTYAGYDNPNVDVNRRILVRSHGFGPNGAEATIEAVFDQRPMPALLVNGDTILNGSVRVQGTQGGVHANGNLDVDNSTCVEQFYGAVGNISPEGGANGGGCPYSDEEWWPGSAPIPVPKLDLSDPRWAKMSDYLLLGDKVYCGPTNTDATRCPTVSTYDESTKTWSLVQAVGPPTYFSYSSAQKKWNAVASANAPGTYYSDGNVSIGGNAVMTLTLFTRGWVDLSGSPVITPALPPSAEGAYAIVAGTDFEITGAMSNPTLAGLYYARDQVRFSGNATVYGLVVAGNFSDCRWPLGSYVCNPDVTDSHSDNLVKRLTSGPHAGYLDTGNGSVSITYNDDSGWKSLSIKSWRDCRGPDPDNPCGNP